METATLPAIKDMKDFTVTMGTRKTPWESGLTWSEAQNASEQLLTAKDMLEAAGMAQWNVTKVQLTLPNGKPAPAYANVRRPGTPDEYILGVVGSAYQPRQPEEVFAFGDNIVDSGQAKWERAGGFNNGTIIFACMELTHLGIDIPGDEGGIQPYLFLMDSYDGFYPTTGIMAYVRPRCINTFEMAVGTQTPYKFRIKHLGGLEGKLQAARDALGIAFKHNADVAAAVNRLVLAKVVDDQVRDIFRHAVWPINDEAPESVVDSAPATKAFELYMTSDTIDPIRGTAWGAFNAVTEYVDHFTDYKGRGVSTAEDVRGKSILLGIGEQRKEAALKALLKVPAQARR